MEFVIIFVTIVVMLVLPVMIGARIVGASNTGFGSALFAVIVIAGVSALFDGAVDSDELALVGTIVINSFFFAVILGTTFLRGFAISVVATIAQFLVLIPVAALVFGSGVVS